MTGRQLLSRYSQEEIKKFIQESVHAKLTDAQIAEKLGCSRITVARWRRKIGLKKAVIMPISDDELADLYKNKFHTASELADYLGVSQDSVIYHLHQYGIKKVIPSPITKVKHNVLMMRYTEDELYDILQKLFNQGFSNKQIAKKLDSTDATIRRWATKFKLRRPYGLTVSDEILKKEYLEKITVLVL